MRVIRCAEGRAFELSPRLQTAVRREVERVRLALHLGFNPYGEVERKVVLRDVVGTLTLTPDVELEIAPKVATEGQDWQTPIAELLSDYRYQLYAGEKPRRLGRRPLTLNDALASIYADRLKRALHRDGPLMMMVRTRRTMPLLRGKLEAGRWVRHAAVHPHRLPCSFDELSPDNDFAAGLAYVAGVLRRASSDSRVRGDLSDTARLLRPGLAEAVRVRTGIELRPLPVQFQNYRAAWAIAASVLAQRALAPSPEGFRGFSFTVAGSSLVEDLLEGSLRRAVRKAEAANLNWQHASQVRRLMLRPLGRTATQHFVIPDAVVRANGTPLAILDAKYKLWSAERNKPTEDDLYQVATAAAHFSCPVAILVYPEQFEARVWEFIHAKAPRVLAAVGLDLLGYRSTRGFEERGALLFRLIRELVARADNVGPPGSTVPT